MPGFELEPVAGGCPVTLPPGETVIGRGALLGVTDKRVSRKHAILKVDGDQLSIKPVHVNPCFYQPNKNGQLLPLDTNKWHRLSPGDNFSLLVDKYAFRVIFTPSEVKSLLRKSCNPSVEDGTSQTPSTLQPTKMPCQQPSEQQIASSISSQLLEVHSVLEKAAEIPKKEIMKKQINHQGKNRKGVQVKMLQLLHRKNPIHLQEFSHPGDSDYCDTETLSQIDNDNRPECPYGTACYRKNPQHKLEYKHTAPPESERRQTRQRVVKKGRGALEDDDDGGEPNEYDLNDSFIDDEEEEDCDPTDEDSDWEPDSQEKDDEDVDTLLEEAENFVKTKK
ncbi:aprataxin and PNK-like factor isoform X4 [Varanus komodoensis]|uniref:aprataxin and PNK-like factor isoform X4 n=1 Tax=Varanus komodoensis TaxID=61221 RepID=UPI001CF7965B|nr:aprataxin and PNK-like factor isoform X4 [Varanus komodoensis]